MVKAFAYLRVSGRGQLSGDGFTRQKSTIKDYADKNGVKVVKTFQEKGISGEKDLDNRPALADLMVALHANGVKTVLVENLGRLARDLMVQESIISDFKRKGFEIVSVTQPDQGDEPTRVFIRQVMGAFFQYEKSMIVSKLRGARVRMKAKTGRCEGAKPFGEFDGEQATIERMTAMRNEGFGVDKIASALNSEGYKPRRGTQWYGMAVSRVLGRQATSA